MQNKNCIVRVKYIPFGEIQHKNASVLIHIESDDDRENVEEFVRGKYEKLGDGVSILSVEFIDIP